MTDRSHPAAAGVAKRTIVVFGATSAIAGACMRRWAGPRVRIVIVARSGDRASSVRGDLIARGADVPLPVLADLTAIDGLEGIVERAWAAAAQPPDLILVAHGTLPSQVRAESDSVYAAANWAANATSPLLLALLLARRIESASHGTLVVITSVAGDRGRRSNALYGAAKASLNVFLDGLRPRLAASGGWVMTVRPGFVDSPMTGDLKKSPLFASPEHVALSIDRGIERHSSVIYTPALWRVLMTTLKLVPERLFWRLPI